MEQLFTDTEMHTDDLGTSDEEIGQEDAWTVISSFFEEKGLARQQLDSFNEFIQHTMQEIVDEMSTFELEPEHQHMPGEDAEVSERKTYKVQFGQIYLSKPMVTEADGMTSTLFPKEARLRNLTYSAPLYVDMTKTVTTISPDGDASEEVEKINKVFIGKVPIMLRSQYCSLHDHTDKELTELGECAYDEGGYFIINGRYGLGPFTKSRLPICPYSSCEGTITTRRAHSLGLLP